MTVQLNKLKKQSAIKVCRLKQVEKLKTLEHILASLLHVLLIIGVSNIHRIN